MKSNGSNPLLNWALIAATIFLVVAGFKYYNQTKTVRSYRVMLMEFNQLQTTQSIVAGLVNETLEYSKAHPDINPTLEAIGLKQPTKPAAK